MAKKPNYRMKRMDRERVKAAKKAARLEARQEKVDQRKSDHVGPKPENPSGELLENSQAKPTDPTSPEDQPENDTPN
jgi:hypothetical protein